MPQGDRARRRAGDRRREQGVRGLVAPDRLRARGQDARGRRRDRAAAATSWRSTLTLDQGKPLKAEAYDEVGELRRVLAHGRRGRQAAGRGAAELVLARQADHAGPPRAGRRRDHLAVELAVHDAGRAAGARARVRQHRRVDAGAHDRGVRGEARRVHGRGRPAARRLQPRDRAGAGGGGRDRAQSGHGRGRLHRLDRDRALGRLRRRRQGGDHRDGRQRPDRGAWTTRISTPPSRRPSSRASCAPGRAARQASACWSTRRCATSSSTASPAG